MRKRRWTDLGSADSHLPFQDWRWLVTRPGMEEKPIVARDARMLAGAREGIEQSVMRRGKGIGDGHAAPGKAVLQVLGQKQPAIRLRGRRKNNRIPDAKMVISGQIGCRHHRVGRRSRDGNASRQLRSASRAISGDRPALRTST